MTKNNQLSLPDLCLRDKQLIYKNYLSVNSIIGSSIEELVFNMQIDSIIEISKYVLSKELDFTKKSKSFQFLKQEFNKLYSLLSKQKYKDIKLLDNNDYLAKLIFLTFLTQYYYKQLEFTLLDYKLQHVLDDFTCQLF